MTRDDDRWDRLEGADADRVDEFLQEYVRLTAREWAVARLCADYRTETGVPVTDIGEQLPELVPWEDDPLSPQAVQSARNRVQEKARESAATLLYVAWAGFLSAEELEDVLTDAREIAQLLAEVDGQPIDVEHERAVDEAVEDALRAVAEASIRHRYDSCPHCGESLDDSSGAPPSQERR